MQLFGEAGQWASLINAGKLPSPHSSKLRHSTQTEYKFVSLLKADMLLKDLATWLGQYAGVTLTHATKIEEYAEHALAKMVHSSASLLGKRLHKTAWTKDCLDRQIRWLIESTKLDSELSMISLTTQPSAMTAPVVTQPHCEHCDKEGGSTETRPALAPYSDGNILMDNDDSVTDDLYQ